MATRITDEFLSLGVDDECSAREILRVLHAAYREEAKLLRLEDFPPLRRTVVAVQQAPTSFFGFREGERLAAVVEIEGMGEGRVGISSFVVHPDFFRRGLGNRLLQQVLGRFPEHDVEVSTASDNEPALRLYEKQGFRRTRTWVREPGISMVTLERRGKDRAE